MIKSLSFVFLAFFTITSVQAQEYARIRESRTSYVIESPKSATISHYKEVEILEERGLSNSLLVEYVDEFRSISKVSLTILDQSGSKVKKLSKSDGVNMSVSASYGVDDSKIFYIDPSWEIYPFIAVIEYEISYSGFTALPGWTPQSDYNVSVQHSSVEVSVASSMPVELIPLQGLGEGVEVSSGSGMVTHKWEVENMKEYLDLPFNKDISEKSPMLMIVPLEFELDGKPGRMDSWVSFGDWFNELNTDLGELSDKTKIELTAISNSTSDKREVIEKVFKHMQSRTRYISIQLGIGGFRSLSVDFVDEKGYGDCKALSTYTKAMLEYLGIASNYVLANAGADMYQLNDTIPSNQFNHVLLATVLEGDTIWMECTDQLVPLNYSGTFTDDRKVLWVEQGNSQLIQSPKYSSEDNTKIRTVEVSLFDDQSAQVKIDLKKYGIYYDDVRSYESMTDVDLKSYNHKRWPFKDYEVSDFTFSQDESTTTLNESMEVWVRGFYRLVRDRIIIKAGVLGENLVITNTDSANAFVEIKRASTTQDEYSIKMPEGFILGGGLQPTDLENKYGSYHLSVTQEDDQVKVSRKLVLKKGEYESGDFFGFKEFIDEVRKADNTKLMFRTKT